MVFPTCLKKSLVFPLLLFSSSFMHCSLKKDFLSLLAVLWNSGSRSSSVPHGQELGGTSPTQVLSETSLTQELGETSSTKDLGETSPIQVPVLHLGHPESQSLLDFCVQGTLLPSSGSGPVTHQLCDLEQVMYPL